MSLDRFQSDAKALQQVWPTRQKAGRVGVTCQSTFSMVNTDLATPVNLGKMLLRPALQWLGWPRMKLFFDWLHIWVGSYLELLSNE